MRHRKLLGVLLLSLGFLLLVGPAKADTQDGVTFTLTFPGSPGANLTGSPGDILTWEYSVTNDSGFSVIADGVGPSAFSGGFGDGSVFDFFANSSNPNPDASISNGSTLTGTFYSFDSDPTVPNSFNSGSFDLFVSVLDGTSFGAGTTLDLTDKYTATITSGVPEPGALTFLAIGLACCLAFARKFC